VLDQIYVVVTTPLPIDGLTFAFTDIEGSTARWERDVTAMQEAVRRHDSILRGAIAEHGGNVFKTGGDGFCAAFERPEDAVAAMIRVQRQLAAEDFSAVDGLRVRAAINSGTADARDGDYFGPTVNKVARLLAIGHGGQVLLSSETVALVDGALHADVSLRDLGAYHLKDFSEPQRVHQLHAPGLPSEFPPLRSLGTLPSDISIIDTAQVHPVPSFSGRDEELVALHAALARDGAVVVVYGLGGVGKSSIAREYGWRNRDAYSVVWWLNAQTEDGIIDGLVSLGAMFVQGLDRLDDRRAAAKRVVNSIIGGFDKPVLLVFDNLEDEGLLRTWLPRTARALATSRDTAWNADVTSVPLQIWSLDSAIAYLRRASARADLSEENARAIAHSLGALPLALAHAAASLRRARTVSPQRYLEHITERLKNAPRGAEYPRSVFATFSMAIGQAERQAPGAAAALCFAASFAPDAIPDELFRQAIETYAQGLTPRPADGTALELRSVIADELRLDEALGALDRLSLVTFAQGPRTYGMHRLVQLAAQDLAGEGAPAWRECAVAVADAAFPNSEDVVAWPQCERLLPHARAALDALPGDTKLLPAAALAYRCTRYVWLRGDFGAAEQLSRLALAIRERALGPDHLDVATCLHVLALVYWEQGRYDEAESLNSRVLAIRERALGPDHPDVALSLNNLAGVYRNQERYEESERMHLRALAIWEKAHGPDHPAVASMLDNIANVYHCQAHYEKAKELRTRALAIREAALGPNHPLVATSLSNLASEYLDQGQFEQAEPLITRGLAIQEDVLGPDHPSVASSLNNLALALHRQGDVDQAERLLWRSLATHEKALGPEHDLVAETLIHLVELYCEQGRYDEAEPLNARARAISEKVLGPDHAMVARSMNSLANVRRGQGRYAEAEPLYRQAMVVFDATVRPDHPDAAQNLDDLATLYRQQGRFGEATPLLAQALAIREKVFGADHPSTKATRNALDALGAAG
jgi:class 3 adenylate cyclase/tetratricopeptide (TPR) repeat protein